MKALFLCLLLAACNSQSLPSTDPHTTMLITKPIEIENKFNLPVLNDTFAHGCWSPSGHHLPSLVRAGEHRRFVLSFANCTIPARILFDASIYYRYACWLDVTPIAGGFKYEVVNEENARCTVKETQKRVYWTYRID